MVALEVQIEKKLAEFTLEVAFHATETPLSILGASGAGKSMLLRCIAGLEEPDRGRITLNERVLFDSTQHVGIPARARRIGMLFQHYALFPHRTVAQNIAFGLRDLPREEQSARTASLLSRTHLAGLEPRYPRELSGGEQQRTALARALAIQPEALLLDEPLSALDTHLRGQVEAQLQETFATYRRPALLVTHNMEEAYRLGEQLLVLARGRVAAFGAKEEIFRRPPSSEVARLTGCKNISRAQANADGTLEALDWNCRLRLANEPGQAPKYLGIRAHHIDFPETANEAAQEPNVFPCWIARTSETPFRITLFLSLDSQRAAAGEPQLQAEVFKEKWERLRDRPQPWRVHLTPQSLFTMPA
ncbi:MAG TPA: sulfate/molybdate ABC transporter ATP-binding protein [Candidatus Acidoferrales bacterium]|jgi:molybdate transport system permease protein|nr:sulfate/molybdate ABC transporter ATP-binding protein [Candidatus Acidoferrales bacterium]